MSKRPVFFGTIDTLWDAVIGLPPQRPPSGDQSHAKLESYPSAPLPALADVPENSAVDSIDRTRLREVQLVVGLSWKVSKKLYALGRSDWLIGQQVLRVDSKVYRSGDNGTSWQEVQPLELPHQLCSFACASYRGFLYVVGGMDFSINKGSPSHRAMMIDTVTPGSRWQQLPDVPRDLPKDFSYGHAFIINGKLYCGGLRVLICLDLNAPAHERAWQKLPTIDMENGAVAINGKLWACDTRGQLNCYDPELGQWLGKGALPERILAGASEAIGNCMYLAGGLHKKAHASLYRYDTTSGVWTRLRDMPTARGSLALTAHNGRLFAVGGYDKYSVISMDDAVAVVESYDPAKDVWQPERSLPGPLRCARVLSF